MVFAVSRTTVTVKARGGAPADVTYPDAHGNRVASHISPARPDSVAVTAPSGLVRSPSRTSAGRVGTCVHASTFLVVVSSMDLDYPSIEANQIKSSEEKASDKPVVLTQGGLGYFVPIGMEKV